MGSSSSFQWLLSQCQRPQGEPMWPVPLGGAEVRSHVPPRPGTRVKLDSEAEGSHTPPPRPHHAGAEVIVEEQCCYILWIRLGILTSLSAPTPLPPLLSLPAAAQGGLGPPPVPTPHSKASRPASHPTTCATPRVLSSSARMYWTHKRVSAQTFQKHLGKLSSLLPTSLPGHLHTLTAPCPHSSVCLSPRCPASKRWK